MKTLGVVAARYASKRFPGKALAMIGDKPMVWWVYQQALKAKRLNKVIVATDDDRIKRLCDGYGMNVVMTSQDHATTASRMHEVAQNIEADFYITINGDEPMIDPNAIDAAIPDTVPYDIPYATNTICPFCDPVSIIDPTNIKVVFDDQFKGLYMSRTPIPYPYAGLEYQYYKHVGVIGYNKKMLEFYVAVKPGRFESIEGIDTLRIIDYGKTLQFCPVEIKEGVSVDTPKDLEKVCKLMKLEGILKV